MDDLLMHVNLVISIYLQLSGHQFYDQIQSAGSPT